jgi:peptidoglycan/xylan/chitin deacetylase (PgdA/CDA1 family)
MPRERFDFGLFRNFRKRFEAYYQRQAARLLFKRRFVISTPRPLISFTFDDFPRSALSMGGTILHRFGVAGTYYASLGLIDQDAPSGRIFVPDDLKIVLDQGHELGCHTFSHCDAWRTPRRAFERSIAENRTALAKLLPGAEFRTFSYPINPPWPLTKSRIANSFLCCRGGGQTFNAGIADLNLLSAYFLEQNRNVQAAKNLIDRNQSARGWLIFATHDIAANPTRFGCTPAFFEDVVRYAVSSGARILPVVSALEALRSSDGGE